MGEWPLEKGQYTVESVSRGWAYTARTPSVGIVGGWAITEERARSKAQAVIDDA